MNEAQTAAQHNQLKSLCFIHSGRSSLPEIKAYTDYFSNMYIVTESRSVATIDQFDILWFFMGLYRYRAKPHQFIIHEYASLSIPPFAKVKNWVKAGLVLQPHLRVFQNSQQTDSFGFRDCVPTVYRDMGVAPQFFAVASKSKSFDLVYVGSMEASRQLHIALDKLLQIKPDLTALMIGCAPPSFRERYRTKPGVKFVGPVSYSDVPGLMAQARFGLNFIPDIYPFNIQTSTKLLEYFAVGLPVIGNMTMWCKQFLHKHNVPYIDLAALDCWPQEYCSARAMKPEISEQFLWHNRIKHSQIELYLPS